VKVYFAAGHTTSWAETVAMKTAGVEYRLFTVYPYLARSTGTGFFENRLGVFRGTIMDSGLFTLMWGAGSKTVQTEASIAGWQDRLVRFVETEQVKAYVVECDCQKLLGPGYAWELRQDLARRLPTHEIINVFHLEDGEKGFRRLCEYSTYLALSVPELRKHQHRHNVTVPGLARLARTINPAIKIHLLGCTENRLMRTLRWCTSADSSSWSSFVRYGMLGGHNIRHLTEKAVEDARQRCLAQADVMGFTLNQRQAHRAAILLICIAHNLAVYKRHAGDQT